jgi:hypothetical protein
MHIEQLPSVGEVVSALEAQGAAPIRCGSRRRLALSAYVRSRRAARWVDPPSAGESMAVGRLRHPGHDHPRSRVPDPRLPAMGSVASSVG